MLVNHKGSYSLQVGRWNAKKRVKLKISKTSERIKEFDLSGHQEFEFSIGHVKHSASV